MLIPVAATARQGMRVETWEPYCQCPCLWLNKTLWLFHVFCEVTKWKTLAPYFTFWRHVNDVCRATSCSQDNKKLCQLPPCVLLKHLGSCSPAFCYLTPGLSWAEFLASEFEMNFHSCFCWVGKIKKWIATAKSSWKFIKVFAWNCITCTASNST